MNILEKTRQFFDLKKKRQQRKIDKLRKIIKQLEAKAKGIKKRIKSEMHEEKREKLEREYKAVKKIIRKGRRQLLRLKAIKNSS